MDRRSETLHVFSATNSADDRSAVPSLLPLLPRPVAGVLFDTCNIFYDDTVWRRWLLRLLGQIGLHTNYRSFFHLWDRDGLAEVYVGRRTFSEAFESFLRSVGMSRGQIEEVQAASRARRRLIEDSQRALPGVKATTAKLAAAGVTLGAICNCDLTGRQLSERLERLGMAGCFAAVVSSIDVTTAMPSAACYRAALAQMQLPAQQAAFVGHDALQLQGAADAGMTTIALNFDAPVQADLYLSRMEDLVEVLRPREAMAAAG